MAQDVLEKLIEEEENTHVRGMRAKLPVFDDYADIPKEETKDIIKEELTNAPWIQQEAARKRIINKILQRDPNYFKRREELKEKYKKSKAAFEKEMAYLDNGMPSCINYNKDACNIMDSFFNFYEHYCELNEENAALKEITNDNLFAQKNEEIKNLQEEKAELNGKINIMFSPEEVQKIMEAFAKHIKDNNGIHNPICEVCCDPVGLVKDIKCSCGERFYIDYM